MAAANSSPGSQRSMPTARWWRARAHQRPASRPLPAPACATHQPESPPRHIGHCRHLLSRSRQSLPALPGWRGGTRVRPPCWRCAAQCRRRQPAPSWNRAPIWWRSAAVRRWRPRASGSCAVVGLVARCCRAGPGLFPELWRARRSSRHCASCQGCRITASAARASRQGADRRVLVALERFARMTDARGLAAWLPS